MGLRGAICGGDRSWDTWGSLLRNSSADFLRTHGHRRGFDEKVTPDSEDSKGSFEPSNPRTFPACYNFSKVSNGFSISNYL